MTTIIELIKNKGDMQDLLFDLKDRERAAWLYQQHYVVLITQAQDWTDFTYEVSSILEFEEAMSLIKDIKNKILTDNDSFFPLNIGIARVACAANDIEQFEYKLFSVSEAKKIVSEITGKEYGTNNILNRKFISCGKSSRLFNDIE